jgi:hypothetical protein
VTSQRDLDSQAVARSQLAEALCCAVPLWIAKWRGRHPDHRINRAKACGHVVAHYGDQILYRSKGHPPKWEKAHGKPGDDDYQPPLKVHDGSPGTASAFNHLAEGIACAAYQPGGITVFGVHWEAHDTDRSSPCPRPVP